MQVCKGWGEVCIQDTYTKKQTDLPQWKDLEEYMWYIRIPDSRILVANSNTISHCTVNRLSSSWVCRHTAVFLDDKSK